MPEISAIAEKVRSKNAGPFWVTIDIFCGTATAYERISKGVETSGVARAFNTSEQLVKRFDIPEMNAVKFSIPRPNVQGTVADRDMHGAGWAALVAEMEVV